MRVLDARHRAVARRVVHDDQLEIGRRPVELLQAVETFDGVVGTLVVDHDDRHDRGRRVVDLGAVGRIRSESFVGPHVA
jgi:hypothetical protein